MLRSVNDMRHYQIHATDGDLGLVHDFLFDDETWTIRFLVADTRRWLPGKRVLLPPALITNADWSSFRMSLGLTKEEIQQSPDIDTNRPVSLEQRYMTQEMKVPVFFGLHGPMATPAGRTGSATGLLERERATRAAEMEPAHQSHLRSIREVVGYHIEASDASIGHVEDFIVDDETWMIRYCVIDTRNWLPAKKVLVPPLWIEEVNWSLAQVKVKLTRDEVKNSPVYNPDEPVNREYESRLYDYYGRPHYWD